SENRIREHIRPSPFRRKSLPDIVSRAGLTSEDIQDLTRAIFDELHERLEGQLKVLEAEVIGRIMVILEKRLTAFRDEIAAHRDEIAGAMAELRQADERLLNEMGAFAERVKDDFAQLEAFFRALPAPIVNLNVPDGAIQVQPGELTVPAEAIRVDVAPV